MVYVLTLYYFLFKPALVFCSNPVLFFVKNRIGLCSNPVLIFVQTLYWVLFKHCVIIVQTLYWFCSNTVFFMGFSRNPVLVYVLILYWRLFCFSNPVLVFVQIRYHFGSNPVFIKWIVQSVFETTQGCFKTVYNVSIMLWNGILRQYFNLFRFWSSFSLCSSLFGYSVTDAL